MNWQPLISAGHPTELVPFGIKVSADMKRRKGVWESDEYLCGQYEIWLDHFRRGDKEPHQYVENPYLWIRRLQRELDRRGLIK